MRKTVIDRKRMCVLCVVLLVPVCGFGQARIPEARERIALNFMRPDANRPGNYDFVHHGPWLVGQFRELGVKWNRLAFSWVVVQPEEKRFDWSAYDRIVDACQRDGIEILATLGGHFDRPPVPAWAGATLAEVVEKHPERLAAFIRAWVERYKGRIHYYEILNEPKVHHQGLTVRAYVEGILKPGYRIIKSIDPGAKVLPCAFNNLPVLGDKEDFWDLARGSYDIGNYHQYADWGIFRTEPTGEREELEVRQFRAEMDKHGEQDKPFWLTEIGFWGTGSLSGIAAAGERDPVLKGRFKPFCTGREYLDHPAVTREDAKRALWIRDVFPRVLAIRGCDKAFLWVSMDEFEGGWKPDALYGRATDGQTVGQVDLWGIIAGDRTWRKSAYALQELLMASGGAPQVRDDSGRGQLPPRWWESVSSACRVSLRSRRGQPALPLKDAAKLSVVLDDMRAQGISSLEIFAPAYGRNSFGGLDARERYRIDPAVGDMNDFRRLVRLAHSQGMPIIPFDNLGYCSVDAPDWLKACNDVLEGKDSKQVRWFLWSQSAEAPAPPGDSIFLIGGKPNAGIWEFTQRAGRYFWSKWAGVDAAGNKVRLPQYNWGSPEWQEEAERIVRFWMDTGIDGMIIDAVNWYANINWEMGRRRMTDVIAEYGNTYSQPEGGGGFHEDPVAWITEGGWRSVQDYGLGIWWEKGSNVVQNAIEKGDPRPLEKALRDYHDRVVAAGGVLYLTEESNTQSQEPQKQRLTQAVSVLIGSILSVRYGRPGGMQDDPEVRRLAELKRVHPALYNVSTRRQIPTTADDKYYAFPRTARDASERILVVMNFQATAQIVTVDMSGVATAGLVDLQSNLAIPRQNPFKVDLPAYGYRLYQVQASRTAE